MLGRQDFAVLFFRRLRRRWLLCDGDQLRNICLLVLAEVAPGEEMCILLPIEWQRDG